MPTPTPDPIPDPGLADPKPPKSPAIVAKTAVKTPRELSLEKEVKALQGTISRTEDRLDGLENTVSGLDKWLQEIFPGGKKPAPTPPQPNTPSKTPAIGPPARGKGILETVANDIWGEA